MRRKKSLLVSDYCRANQMYRLDIIHMPLINYRLGGGLSSTLISYNFRLHHHFHRCTHDSCFAIVWESEIERERKKTTDQWMEKRQELGRKWKTIWHRHTLNTHWRCFEMKVASIQCMCMCVCLLVLLRFTHLKLTPWHLNSYFLSMNWWWLFHFVDFHLPQAHESMLWYTNALRRTDMQPQHESTIIAHKNHESEFNTQSNEGAWDGERWEETGRVKSVQCIFNAVKVSLIDL